MNKIEKQDLQEILWDVRKAYRLLFLYQERVLSSVRCIKEKLKLSEPMGYLWTSQPNKDQEYCLKKRGWDWLAMYNYDFHFGIIPNTSITLSIIVVSDSGLFEHNDIAHGAIDKRIFDINNFATPEKSDTLVVFCASTNVNTWWVGSKPISNDFKKNNFKKDSKPYFETNDAGDKFFSMSFPMSEFIDEVGISTTVDKFVAGCKEKGIDIKPETKQVTAT